MGRVGTPCLEIWGDAWHLYLFFAGFISFSKFIYIQSNSLGEQQ